MRASLPSCSGRISSWTSLRMNAPVWWDILDERQANLPCTSYLSYVCANAVDAVSLAQSSLPHPLRLLLDTRLAILHGLTASLLFHCRIVHLPMHRGLSVCHIQAVSCGIHRKHNAG